MRKIALTALAACLCTSVAQAQQYELLYDPSDGSLTIVSDGPIINYVINSGTDAFLEDENPAALNHERFLSGTGASTPSVLSESNPFAAAPAGVYNLGSVLPAGLSGSQLLAAITENGAKPKYVTGLGQPKIEFIVPTPEPTSLTLLAAGGLLLARRRRAA